MLELFFLLLIASNASLAMTVIWMTRLITRLLEAKQ